MIAKSLSKTKQYLYSIALLVTVEKKTCTNLALASGVKHDQMYRHLTQDKADSYKDGHLQLAKNLFADKSVYLLIDDTRINKDYATLIEGISRELDGSSGKITKGLQMVTAMLTDTQLNLPFDIKPLFSKWVCPEYYQTKSAVAWKVIQSATSNFSIKMVLADAHYATQELLEQLIMNWAPFLMKIPRNRKVRIGDQEGQLQDLLRLKRNEHTRCSQGFLNGLPCWFYVVKLAHKKTVYLVSSERLNSKEVISIYRIRWLIEKFHRTSKQKLGLQDCQSRSLKKQLAHCHAVMHSYAIAEIVRERQKLLTTEHAIRALRNPKSTYCIDRILSLDQEFQIVA